VHIERTGRFRIERPLAEAFGFLSPEGERRWVDGWVPTYMHPAGTPSDAPHTVFTTDHGGEHTVWIVLRYAPHEGVAEYVRLTPGSRVGTVTVIGHERDGGTDVEVTYRLTSLSPAGDAALAGMNETAYAGMLGDWQARIARVLAS
jgi:hypothetical protein